MSEKIERYHLPDNPDHICLSCDVNRYLNSHKVRNANCCRWCENISYLHPIAEQYYKDRPDEKETKVYCKLLGLMMSNVDVCQHFKNDRVFKE